MKLSHAFVAALAGFGAFSMAAGYPVTSAIASASWSNNINRCPDPSVRKDAALFDLAGSSEWRTQATRDTSLHFSTNAGLEGCPQFEGLNRIQAGVGCALRHKLGLGPYAAVLRADLAYSGSWYHEPSRTGTRLNAAVSWSQRWNENWQTVLTGEFMHNNAHSPAYDYQNRGLSLEVRYEISARWQLSAGYRRQWGDQVVYAWQSPKGLEFPYVYDIWINTTEDPTFGKDWYAYTIDAHADSGWISLSCALDDNSSLPLRFEETSVVGHGESFRTSLLSLSLVHRF